MKYLSSFCARSNIYLFIRDQNSGSVGDSLPDSKMAEKTAEKDLVAELNMRNIGTASSAVENDLNVMNLNAQNRRDRPMGGGDIGALTSISNTVTAQNGHSSSRTVTGMPAKDQSSSVQANARSSNTGAIPKKHTGEFLQHTDFCVLVFLRKNI